jgi:hypothetical protein
VVELRETLNVNISNCGTAPPFHNMDSTASPAFQDMRKISSTYSINSSFQFPKVSPHSDGFKTFEKFNEEPSRISEVSSRSGKAKMETLEKYLLAKLSKDSDSLS